MQRLYIGGLGPSVTQKDLKDRFGKFGEVEDVELRTRKDDAGVPFKSFGYVNINISEADLKKCMTVLNKSKWKGGTLQIEPAKESFLQRLAQERQAAEEQRLQQPADDDQRQKMLDSLSKAGVDNFTMKAAVPGTEIPGHKDWVVSKFGRVLPVLQLRCQKGKRARTVKYDPSKYSHNIRRLDLPTADQPTPVTQLTWEVQGGDDDISKKRRGEFPPFEPSRPKKSKTDVVNSSDAVGRTRSADITEAPQRTNGFELQTDQRKAQRRGTHLTGNDVDSEEESCRLVAAQEPPRGALRQDVQEDHLEVVGLDYLMKAGSSRQQQKGDEDEEDYDSADTDELFASRKPPPPSQETLTKPPADNLSGNKAEKKRNMKRKSKTEEEDCDSVDPKEQLTSRQQSSEEQCNSSRNQIRKKTALSIVKPSSSESDSDEDGQDDEDEVDEELDSTDTDSDSDYEAMFSNVTHLEISMTDLQKLAEESQQTSETPGDTTLKSEGAPKKGTLPEEILAALMEDDSSEDEKKKKKKKRRKGPVAAPLPAFQGTSALNEGSKTDECQRRAGEEVTGGRSGAPQLNHRAQKMSESEEEEESEEESDEETKGDVVESMDIPKALKMVSTKVPIIVEKTATGSSSSDEEEEEEEDERTKAAAKSSLTQDKRIVSAADTVKGSPPHSESSSSEEEEEEKVPGRPRALLGAKEEEERQRKANIRRLAAVQQRQKEAEENKKLIQGALANLDAPTARAGKHTVFGSDEDDEDEQPTTSEVTTAKKTLLQDSQSEDEATGDEVAANENGPTKGKVSLKPGGPQLFDSSEDEEDGDEDEDLESSRFDIKPQFEGQSGQKLMALQSRFGTDERFRMDSRFLEEDEKQEEESERKRSTTEDDEGLEEERKKSLSILQSVLGSSQQTCSSKTASKAKTFRDVSALHYDPSREEHSQFETKTDETKKESKSARKKKREEAQKLPEVSKEIYYDVTGDLKAMFGLEKDDKDDKVEEEGKLNWDQEEEEDGGEKDEEQPPPTPPLFSDPSAEGEESSGFKFSFFGNDAEAESEETAEYKVESIQAPKVSWQQDPRLQDSSSGEDEEEQEEDEEKTSTNLKTEEETPATKDLFFFYPDDSRLTEGPRLFCRSSQLEEQREGWEERRSTLRQEYRKKHKDARRKLKSSQKS